MNPQNHEQEALILAPQAMTNSATATANFDINGKGSYATIRVLLSSEASTSAAGPTLSLLEADDTNTASFATITSNVTPSNAAAMVHTYKVDLRGRKRYLRLSVTSGTNGTHDNLTVAVDGTISHMGRGPTNTTDMVATTNDTATVV